MAFRLKIKPIASEDIDDAITWYEKEIAGLGQRFLVQVEIAKQKILQQPSSFSYLKNPVRKCRLKKFPYNYFIYY